MKKPGCKREDLNHGGWPALQFSIVKYDSLLVVIKYTYHAGDQNKKHTKNFLAAMKRT